MESPCRPYLRMWISPAKFSTKVASMELSKRSSNASSGEVKLRFQEAQSPWPLIEDRMHCRPRCVDGTISGDAIFAAGCVDWENCEKDRVRKVRRPMKGVS